MTNNPPGQYNQGQVFLDFFEEWLAKNFNVKTNQLKMSNTFVPKRTHIATIDLSTARGEGNSYAIPTQFKSCRVEAIYQTSNPTNLVDGSLKMMFDYGNIGNVLNAITLKQNDSFIMDSLVAGAFVVNDAQADTSVRLAFYVDIDFTPGSTLSEVTGSVEVTNAPGTDLDVQVLSTSKYPAPSSVVIRAQTSGGTVTYTIPVGKYAWVTGSATGVTAATNAYVEVGTNGIICYAFGANVCVTSPRVYAVAGEVVTVSCNGANNNAVARIEVYDV